MMNWNNLANMKLVRMGVLLLAFNTMNQNTSEWSHQIDIPKSLGSFTMLHKASSRTTSATNSLATLTMDQKEEKSVIPMQTGIKLLENNESENGRETDSLGWKEKAINLMQTESSECKQEFEAMSKDLDGYSSILAKFREKMEHTLLGSNNNQNDTETESVVSENINGEMTRLFEQYYGLFTIDRIKHIATKRCEKLKVSCFAWLYLIFMLVWFDVVLHVFICCHASKAF